MQEINFPLKPLANSAVEASGSAVIAPDLGTRLVQHHFHSLLESAATIGVEKEGGRQRGGSSGGSRWRRRRRRRRRCSRTGTGPQPASRAPSRRAASTAESATRSSSASAVTSVPDPVCRAVRHCAGAGAAVIDLESSYSYLYLNTKSADASRPHAIHKASRRLREPRGFSHYTSLITISGHRRPDRGRGAVPRLVPDDAGLSDALQAARVAVQRGCFAPGPTEPAAAVTVATAALDPTEYVRNSARQRARTRSKNAAGRRLTHPRALAAHAATRPSSPSVWSRSRSVCGFLFDSQEPPSCQREERKGSPNQTDMISGAAGAQGWGETGHGTFI